MAQYAHPEMLVETKWVAQHGRDAGVRLVEVDVDTTAYDQDHILGAIAWNWTTQLCDTVQRDIIPKDAFEKLMADSGIGNDTTVILYGDNNNWFAAWALWQMKIYGHQDVRLMNGGRKKWIAERRELTTEVPAVTAKAGTLAQFSTRTDPQLAPHEERFNVAHERGHCSSSIVPLPPAEAVTVARYGFDGRCEGTQLLPQ
jgi:thiosulfate/3-mercaptopyruvate sulfurtransferase